MYVFVDDGNVYKVALPLEVSKIYITGLANSRSSWDFQNWLE